MATETDKTQITAPADDAAKTPQPKKGKSKLLFYGGIGVGVIGLGVALAIFVLKPMMTNSSDTHKDSKSESTTHQSKAEHPKKTEPAKKHESAHGGGEGEGDGTGLVYAVKDMVINPAGTNGARFLSVSFGLELANPELSSELEARSPLVRDALITIMSSKTVAQLTDAREKEITRLQIKKRLSDLLETSDITAVYFTDFVLQ